MDELEEIRQRKMQEIQNQMEAQQQEQAHMEEQIGALETLVKSFLDKEATMRYGTLKTVHPEKATQVLLVIGNAIQSGSLKEKLNDEQFKEILKKIEPDKRETNIKRK